MQLPPDISQASSWGAVVWAGILGCVSYVTGDAPPISVLAGVLAVLAGALKIRTELRRYKLMRELGEVDDVSVRQLLLRRIDRWRTRPGDL